MTTEAPRVSEDGDEAPRTSGAQQRARALQIVEAWRALGRDLLVAVAGHPEATPSAHLLNGFSEAAAPLAVSELSQFLLLLGRVDEALQENAAPRLALEVAMLAWPQPSAADRARRPGR
jgi:hypothetical protein